ALATVRVSLALGGAAGVGARVAFGAALEARRVDVAVGDAGRHVAGCGTAGLGVEVALAAARDLELARAGCLDGDRRTLRFAAALDLRPALGLCFDVEVAAGLDARLRGRRRTEPGRRRRETHPDEFRFQSRPHAMSTPSFGRPR